jgi:hypothetical protein
VSYGTNTVLTLTALWSVASSGFVNPGYLGPADPTTGLTSSIGFEIEPAATLIIGFDGTYTGATVVHEQTLDVTGAAGWFAVQGYATDGSSSGSGVCTTGTAYAFPISGVRHRVRVTALATGTMTARASMDSDATVVLIGAASGGGGSIPVVFGNRTPKGYQQIVGMVASTALTVPAGANVALITCEGQAVRWRDDGTAPTAAIGMELQIGPALFYDGTLSAIRFIQEAATATLNVSYYS